jgi:hypothetical protein
MLVLEYCSFTRVSSLIAFCLFTKTFVRLVLLVLSVYVHRSLAYKYPPGVLLRFIKHLVIWSEVPVVMDMIVCEVEQPRA